MTKSFSQGLMICNLFPSCERKKNGNDQLEKMTGKIHKMNEFLFGWHNKRIKQKHETKIRLFNRFLSTTILLKKNNCKRCVS